jgi:hypothetical protein
MDMEAVFEIDLPIKEGVLLRRVTYFRFANSEEGLAHWLYVKRGELVRKASKTTEAES